MAHCNQIDLPDYKHYAYLHQSHALHITQQNYEHDSSISDWGGTHETSDTGSDKCHLSMSPVRSITLLATYVMTTEYIDVHSITAVACNN